MKIDLQNLQTEFQKLYGQSPRFFRAPGRVNLIGEHTDYNGGFVLPMAIERQTIVAAAARKDRKIRVRSTNLDEDGEVNLDAPEQKMRDSWLDFVEGVARILERQGVKLRGADLLISSDVPHGAGLSSSAALEISVGLALTKISGQTVDKVTLALAGQKRRTRIRRRESRYYGPVYLGDGRGKTRASYRLPQFKSRADSVRVR
jgi:galactokinase